MRNTADLFERRRKAEADLAPATYVKPLGRGYHLVRLPGGTEYTVGAGQGSTTYAPGQVVTIATYSGSRDRQIVTGPSPGRRGGSLAQSAFVEETGPAVVALHGVWPRELEVGAETPGYVWGYGIEGVDLYYYTRDEADEEIEDERARVFGELWIPDLGFQSAAIVVDADSIQTPAATWATVGSVSSDDIAVDETDSEGDAVTDDAAYLAIIWIDTEAETVELSKGAQVENGIAPPSPTLPGGDAAIPWVSVIRRAGDLDTGPSEVFQVPPYGTVRSITEALGGQEHMFAWFLALEDDFSADTYLHLRA